MVREAGRTCFGRRSSLRAPRRREKADENLLRDLIVRSSDLKAIFGDHKLKRALPATDIRNLEANRSTLRQMAQRPLPSNATEAG